MQYFCVMGTTTCSRMKDYYIMPIPEKKPPALVFPACLGPWQHPLYTRQKRRIFAERGEGVGGEVLVMHRAGCLVASPAPPRQVARVCTLCGAACSYVTAAVALCPPLRITCIDSVPPRL